MKIIKTVDFTLKKYQQLLIAVKNAGYNFQTMEDFIINPQQRAVVLRHDSDIWPYTDLNMAAMEYGNKVRATYYFRMPETFRETIAKKIISMNHEIGYHYEDLARMNGNIQRAVHNFKENLDKMRKYYPVTTVVRHGRPLSKWESLNLWKEINLQDFHLIAEPYLSIDYSKVLYLTDNGSKWNARQSNIRDKVNGTFTFNIRSTDNLISHFQNNQLPDHIILNIHPARWTNNYAIWLYRFFLQKAKNLVKSILNGVRNAR